MADIYFYQGDTDEDDGGYSDSSITTPSQVRKKDIISKQISVIMMMKYFRMMD